MRIDSNYRNRKHDDRVYYTMDVYFARLFLTSKRLNRLFRNVKLQSLISSRYVCILIIYSLPTTRNSLYTTQRRRRDGDAYLYTTTIMLQRSKKNLLKK